MRKHRRVRRDFAFGWVIICGQCGRTLVGENFTDILRIPLSNESARCRCGSATDPDIQASPETYRHRRLPSRLLKNILLRDARTHRRRSMHVSACFSILPETCIQANLKDSLFLKLCKSACIGAHNFIVYRPARMRGPTFSGFQYLILNSSV